MILVNNVLTKPIQIQFASFALFIFFILMKNLRSNH